MHSFKTNVISCMIGSFIGIVIGILVTYNQKEPVYVYYSEYSIMSNVYLPESDVQYEVPEEIVEEVIEEEIIEKVIYYDSLDLLARCTLAEAGNQSEYGKRLVIDVILNRVDDPTFPNTVEEVIKQQGQFSVVSNGSIDRQVVTDEIIAIIGEEIQNRSNYDVLYFNAIEFQYGTPWEKVGDHYFSTK